MQTGAGGIIRSGPLLPVIMEITEHAKGFFPTRWEGVEGFAARQFHARNDKMKFMVSGVIVPHPKDIALIRLKSGKSNGFKIVHNSFFLRRCHPIIRMPGKHSGGELPFSVNGIRECRHVKRNMLKLQKNSSASS